MKKYFVLNENTSAAACKQMDNETVKKLWNSFCLGSGNITFTACEDYVFRVGETELPTLCEQREYALTVDENGIAVVGKDYGGLMRGFMSLLMKIEYDDETCKIEAVTEQSDYKMKNRMLHICVFPENDLYYIKKLIRLAALCQYSHIVIEFWGMLKYDCLKELAWPHAFTKAQAQELIGECRQLGIAPVPMFNMLGHATASRVIFGKHVVLDQNPKLQYLFTPDGWAWNIKSPKVVALLKNIRKELYELFGDGEYIHIGCDEAYYYTNHENERKHLSDFLNRLTNEIVSEGKRPIMWADMFLEADDFVQEKKYICLGNKGETHKLLKSITKETVMADWQYECKEVPVETLLYLNNEGFDCLGSPWLTPENYGAVIDTVAENNTFGLLLTTWQTLWKSMPGIVRCAQKCGAQTFTWSYRDDVHGIREETATLLRRVSFEGNTYEQSGFKKWQIKI